jgi:ParB family chromosome partitioning protein
MGHARALVSAGDEDLQLSVYSKIIEEDLSVRDVETLLRYGQLEEKDNTQTSGQTPNKPTVKLSDKQRVFREHLSDKLSAKIEIKKSSTGNGKIVVNFNSEVDLNRIIEILKKS